MYSRSKIYMIKNAIFYFPTGIIFCFTGELILRRLYTFHNDYYLENSKKISISTFGLSFPLIVRGIYDIVILCHIKF